MTPFFFNTPGDAIESPETVLPNYGLGVERSFQLWEIKAIWMLLNAR